MKNSDIQLSLYIDTVSSLIHADQDYFSLIKQLVALREEQAPKSQAYMLYQEKIDCVYARVLDEMTNNNNHPVNPVKFGTSGWRGILGKDLNVKTVTIVTQAIVEMYAQLDKDSIMASLLGVKSLEDAKEKGCVIGFDNRFGNDFLAQKIIGVLTSYGFKVYSAGEATTGTLSAAVMELSAAFSINLTPSHNPLDYGGFKFNASDAGPASPEITNWVTNRANELLKEFEEDDKPDYTSNPNLVEPFDALDTWISLVRKGSIKHGINYDEIIENFANNDKIALVVDCVHGASRVNVKSLFKGLKSDRLKYLRIKDDPTFSGIAPEPSSENLKITLEHLNTRPEPIKLGVIMDPDADRVRFCDDKTEISMNQFGAMAYHFLHEVKGIKGMVAKTVATSNFANQLAKSFNEEIFEPRVGFKEFKPVINKALVCFEESDGISVIGHTPEKDAYIGLILALDMVLTLNKNLGEYLKEIQEQYGYFYPAKDGITVTQKGETLNNTLAELKKYKVGCKVTVADKHMEISEVINIDGYKMIFADGSWLMIRASGTEPKVRFYVEARDESIKNLLFDTAKNMLSELGLI